MLKSLLLMTLLISSSSTVYSMECQQREIQIQGFAKVLDPELGDVHETICRFQIDFSKPIRFSVSQVCPLDLDPLREVQFIDADCEIKQGAEVSGVIVEKNGIYSFE